VNSIAQALGKLIVGFNFPFGACGGCKSWSLKEFVPDVLLQRLALRHHPSLERATEHQRLVALEMLSTKSIGNEPFDSKSLNMSLEKSYSRAIYLEYRHRRG